MTQSTHLRLGRLHVLLHLVQLPLHVLDPLRQLNILDEQVDDIRDALRCRHLCLGPLFLPSLRTKQGLNQLVFGCIQA